MNREILSAAVQAYLRTHEDADASAIALKKSPFPKVSSRELAAQIDGRQRAKRKIPEWALAPDILFPEKLNLEQCSSSLTAAFKSSLIAPQSRLIDLTGGFAVDSYYFAKRAKEVIHCELNTDLSALVAHNFEAFAVENVTCHAGDGLAFLRNSDLSFDYIYSDPSRRVAQQKVFRLEDCEPNIVQQQDLFFSKAAYIITKLAPLLDIHLALQTLKHVKAVYVVSVDNDCKELLFVQEKGYTGKPEIHAVRIKDGERQFFSFTYEEEQLSQAHFAAASDYLYDPDVVITKAGAFKTVGNRFNLNKLSQNSHLYSSSSLHTDFPGRIFHIEQVSTLATFKKQKAIKKANIIAKNFPMKVDEIRKKYKIQDGGAVYLFFTTLENAELVVIVASRLSV